MMKISILEAGFFHSDGGAMFGLLPKQLWSRAYPADHKNICRMAMRALLYESGDRIILFDAGAGLKKDRRMNPYEFCEQKDLAQLIREKGIDPARITDIVLSHLHFDHCGGITKQDSVNGIEPLFPNANCHISKDQWERQFHTSQLDKDAFFRENTAYLSNNPRLHLIEEETAIGPKVVLKTYDGHTPGQLVSFIGTGDEQWVFAGDVVPLALSLRTDSISAFDLWADKAVEERIRLLEEVVTRKARIIFCHDAYTISARVKKTGNRFVGYDLQSLNSI